MARVGLSGTHAQASVVSSHDSKPVDGTSSWVALARECNGLAHQHNSPFALDWPGEAAPRRPSRRKVARARAKRVQLNADVSAEFKQRLRMFANQQRVSVGAALEALCGRALAGAVS